MTCYVSSGMLNPTHSLTHSDSDAGLCECWWFVPWRLWCRIPPNSVLTFDIELVSVTNWQPMCVCVCVSRDYKTVVRHVRLLNSCFTHSSLNWYHLPSVCVCVVESRNDDTLSENYRFKATCVTDLSFWSCLLAASKNTFLMLNK